MVEKIDIKKFEEHYYKVSSYEDRYDLLEDIEDYLVEYLGYSWEGGPNTIGEDTDFEIVGNLIIVDVDCYDDTEEDEEEDD